MSVDAENEEKPPRYSPQGLAGRQGLLWRWGDMVRYGSPSREVDSRDSFSALGMRPVVGKTYHSTLPLPVELLDVGRAFNHLAEQTANHDPRRWAWLAHEPLNIWQAVMHLYYVEGLGLAFGANQHNHEERQKRVELFGVEGVTGDAAVAKLLHTYRDRAWRLRQEAITRMSRYLLGEGATHPGSDSTD